MLRNACIAFVALLLGSAPLLGAEKPSTSDVALTYIGQRSLEATTSQNFWSQGGSIELGTNIWRGLGIAADVTGTYAGSIGSSSIPLSLLTITFGPRYRWHDGHRISAYGQGLLGVANGFNSLFPTATGAESGATSLALQVGGGLDVKLSRRMSLRVIDAGWLRTQLPNSTNDVQNSLRLGAGVALRFGH